MTAREIGIFIFRIFSLICILKTPMFTVSLFGMVMSGRLNIIFSNLSQVYPFLISVLFLTAYMFLAIFLWIKAEFLAGFIIRGVEGKVLQTSISFYEAQLLVCTAVGLYFIGTGLSFLITTFNQIQITEHWQREMMVRGFVQTIFGAVLFFGSHLIVGLIPRKRMYDHE